MVYKIHRSLAVFARQIECVGRVRRMSASSRAIAYVSLKCLQLSVAIKLTMSTELHSQPHVYCHVRDEVRLYPPKSVRLLNNKASFVLENRKLIKKLSVLGCQNFPVKLRNIA